MRQTNVLDSSSRLIAGRRSGRVGLRCRSSTPFGLGLVASVLCLTPFSLGQLATFDSLPEGIAGTLFTTAGITFFDGDWRFPGQAPPTRFCIDAATDPVQGEPFSPPNALTLQSFDPGPQIGYNRIGEFKATYGGLLRTFASVDVFYSESDLNNSISLEALLGGVVVASDTLVLPGTNSFTSRRFVVSGPEFDTIRLIGRGGLNSGCFFGFVDNVRIDFVPTPGAASAVTLAAVFGAARRRRS